MKKYYGIFKNMDEPGDPVAIFASEIYAVMAKEALPGDWKTLPIFIDYSISI